ncbi:Ig-like domain-containing protein [cf. Phormidesmis sp. LEGE 11477]|uniref:Ig-like domain-containing protein n=1 Tax=cf. Phormidesmis sp. LEGE 11477 TaxID=1828680 RepID=UPI00187EC2B3|nr:Ig-like domain-containing protein [cf. Phormidesmis sp. LEGE 11477]MBE9063506.1 tandem-95 repeat protein [cf. Phormidesmis sp. LEGE 11477]
MTAILLKPDQIVGDRNVTLSSAANKPLVVIDAGVYDVSALAADAQAGEFDVLLLSEESDAITQITAALEQASFSSLHVVSHGTPGSLRLGNAALSLKTLDQHESALAAWATALKGKDILLYGCQVAKGAIGYLFLRQLQQLTGANIAASTERVGRVSDHANWTLETQLGSVQTPIIFSSQLQATYAGSFEPVVDFSLSTDTLVESEGTPFSFIFDLSEPPPEGGTVVRFEAINPDGSNNPQAINQWNLFTLGFTGLAETPVDVSPNLDFSAFEVTIVEQQATIDVPVFNDFQDDSPDPYVWRITPVSGGTVGNDTAEVTIYDTRSEVPTTTPTLPEVSISADIDTLVEDEGTEVTLTVTLSEPPADGALLVDIGTGKPFALGDFDIFPPPPQASSTGGQLVQGFPDNSGFTFAITSQEATITLPVFDDQDRTEDGATTDPDSPLRNDDIGEEQTTFSIAPSDTYTIASGAGEVTLTLRDTNAVNAAPVADDDSYSTDFGTELTIDAAAGVLANDADADGDDLSVTIDAEPSNGSVSLNDDGSFSYTPNDGFSGDDSFDYTISDGNGGSDTATVTVNVGDPANAAPVADDDSYSTDFGTELTVNAANGVLDGDTDADGDDLSAAIDAEPSNGSVSLNDDGSFTYTPDADFTGDDSFTYTVSDGNGGEDTGTVTVTVGGAPDPLVVGLSAEPTDLVEDDGIEGETTTTLTFTLSEAPPEGGVAVTVDSDIQASLAEFDVGAASFSGLQLVGANADSSGFTVNITSQEATITLPVFDDDLNEGLEEITYALQESDDYGIDGSAAAVTFSITDDDEPAVENTPPVASDDSYSTTADTALTVAVGDGVLTNDTDADGDAIVATAVGSPSNGSVELNEDGSFTYTPDAGFVGTDSFTYQAADNEDSSETATVTITVEDGEVPDPVVSFSVTPDTVSEADDTALVLNFSVDGEIPDGGITVNLEGDTAEILQQFLAPDGDGAVQARVTDEGNILYRFDTSFAPGAGLVGGTLDVFSLEDGDPAEDNSDPAAAGTGFLSNFSFTITEANASITLPVSDDLVQEPDQTFTYTLADGEGYVVDPDANSGTFTVIDGITPATSPVVGVTATPETLVESEQTQFTVTFTTEGDIPADGLVVQLQGPPRSIAEFDVNATNPRLPEDETVVEGVVVTGGSIVGTDEVAGSLFLRITDPTATVSVPVFDDGPGEGTENFTFNLIDGENYEVDAAASGFDLTIEEGEGGLVPDIVGTDEGETLIGTDGDNFIQALGGDDTAAGGLGDDIIEGGDGDDVLRGDLNRRSPQNNVMGGDDIIFGGEGNDRIGGKSGNDILSGDAGDDIIFGDDGDDIIMGVTGNDILVGDDFSGGSGSDLFVFGNGDGTDTILDFEVGTDRIGLVEGELAFADLTLTQDGENTLLGVTSTSETLAVLNGVQASSLGESSFAVVPDVSNIEEALALV